MFNAVSSWWGAIQKKDSDSNLPAEESADAQPTQDGKEDVQQPESSTNDTASSAVAPGPEATTTSVVTGAGGGGGGASSGDESPVTESASEQSGSDTAAPNIPPLPGKKKPRKGGANSDASEPATSSDDEDAEGPDKVDEKIEAAKQAIEDVSTKAVSAAKEWGSYLFSVGKFASKTVADTAKQFKTTVEEKTILGEFTREQEKFVNENKEKGKHAEAALPPWVGYNEEETMKKQILALSSDKRNFLRNPPAGVQFSFDFDTVYPIAMATLQEDPELQKMRFELVPKQINEENFWRNYFYRVSLIKQSTQLTSIAQSTDAEDMPQWEKELQKELQEYDMVDDSVTAEDIDLEKEILQQLEEENKTA
ncbi:synapse-associated protein 1 isoform X2 [Octopus bimaculoides]|uniref:synapse-associated protein 1 isoform X2 n=1 Tax=Octopus bimaculoides TaxID=37653 RepID=UPI0022E27C9E|nr:synapse-associated protein 1 isoform X2 [Octopus bimaculoides]